MDAAELFKAAVSLLTRKTIYYGCYPYKVSSQQGDKLNLISASPEPGLPGQIVIPKAHGMAGVKEQCAPGSTVLVKFQRGSPGAPIVSDYLESTPISITLDAATLITLGSGAVSMVALANLVTAELAKISATLGPIVTAFNLTPPGPPAPVLKPPTPIPPYVPGSVAAAKVKAE